MRKLYFNVTAQIIVVADDAVSVKKIEDNLDIILNQRSMGYAASLEDVDFVRIEVTDAK